MKAKILIKNLKAIYAPTVNGAETAPVDILITDTDISEIGHGLNEPEADVIDGTNCVAIPGLVNTHHHFYQMLTRAIPRMQDAALFPWLKEHYQVWQGLDEEGVYWSSLAAMAELIQTGCTCTTDHHYLFPEASHPELIDLQFAAAAQSGIRFIATRGSMSLGQSQGGLPPDSVVQSEDVILKDCQRLIEKYHDPGPRSMRRIALAPCSPFSVSENSMRATAELARTYNVRLHTHLAETIDEQQYCLRRFGCRPVALMERLGWIGSDVWFAHCVHLNEQEIRLFGETGTGVAHCPSSNMRLGSGIAPIIELMAAGAPVGLAVDGSASNDSSDMLGELRQALFLQRVTKGADSMTVEDAFVLGTEGGAAVLGFDNIGVLAPGRPADIALFSTDGIDFGGVHDLVGGLILTGTSHRAHSVIIQGHVVLQAGQFTSLNISEIRNHLDHIAGRLLETASRRTGKNYLLKK